jgi:hypothetical protein
MKFTKQKSPGLIQISEAAKITGMTVWAIRKRAERSAIPCVRIDGYTWFNPEKLLEWKKNLKP